MKLNPIDFYIFTCPENTQKLALRTQNQQNNVYERQYDKLNFNFQRRNVNSNSAFLTVATFLQLGTDSSCKQEAVINLSGTSSLTRIMADSDDKAQITSHGTREPAEPERRSLLPSCSRSPVDVV